MRRAADVGAAPPALDDEQQTALARTDRILEVRGAPGTGKSTLAVEFVAAAVQRGVPAQQCLLLSPTRVAATVLRDRVTARLGGTTSEPLSRSHQALGFGLLRQAAALRGLPTPRLLTGPEQDVVLKELLAGYEQGAASAPPWPEEVREALSTRGFRAELRDLLMRAVEWTLEAPDLRRLGEEHARPEWIAAAQVLNDYDQVTALSRPGAYDPAWILGAAADLLDEDPAALARVRDQVRFVVVDDAQELTFAAARLLRRLAGPQTQVRLLNDPDVTVQGFRGADPRQAEELLREWGCADPVTLSTSHRRPTALLTAAAQVSARIGAVGGVGHREPQGRPGGRVEVALLRAVSQESAHIAAALRRAHLVEGVPWSQLAVIVRGHGRTGPVRRALNAAGVPVAVPPSTVPLRDEPVVRPFLSMLQLAVDLHEASSSTDAASEQATATVERSIPVQTAVDLLTSPIGGADAIALRRLRRHLRRLEIEAGGSRNSDELIAAAVLDPDVLQLQGPDLRPARRVMAVIRAGALELDRAGAGAESVLWQMWQAAGVAPGWQAAALRGGVAGRRADRDLDAMVELFGAAAAFVDRLPGARTRDFLDHVRGQDVPGDSLVAQAPHDDAVAVLTPAGAAGREWHTVVVAGVQEGVWPDLRLRGSLLGSEQLVNVIAGRGTSLRGAQAAVRYDETRQFLVAISRARERVLITAVRSEDEQPSPYLDLVDPLSPPENSGLDPLRPFTDADRPMSLPAVVADLRRTLAVGLPAARADAARDLARLAREGVAGADPDGWWALTDLTDERPLRAPDQQVRVSPSAVETFNRCGLRWLLTTAGAQGPDIGAAGIGTLVHEIAAEFADSAPEAMHEALDERWVRLGLGQTWVAQRERDRAHRMLTYLQDYLVKAASEGWRPAGVERGFVIEHERALLTGRVDRLERHAEKGVRVIDLKTGSSKPAAEAVARHGQLGAYQVAVLEGGFGADNRPGGAALVQLGRAAGVRSQHTQQQEAITSSDSWAHELVAETAEGMAAASVLAIANESCGTCPVRRCCPLLPEGGVV